MPESNETNTATLTPFSSPPPNTGYPFLTFKEFGLFIAYWNELVILIDVFFVVDLIDIIIAVA